MSGDVIVTGASSGIGRAVHSRLLEAGWSVVGVDISDPPEHHHPDRVLIKGDVANMSTWRAVRAVLVRERRRVRGIVNCAGIQPFSSVRLASHDEFARAMDVNVWAVIAGVQALARLLRRGSAIVNVGSVHAIASGPGYSLYAASKGAVSAMTRQLAMELARKGVRVNAILPGAVDTVMLREGLRASAKELDIQAALTECASRQVMRRVGLPREVAEAVLFMLDSTRAGFITGAELVVDGGGCARLGTLPRDAEDIGGTR